MLSGPMIWPPSGVALRSPANRVANAFVFVIGGLLLLQIYPLKWFSPGFNGWMATYLLAGLAAVVGLPWWSRRAPRAIPLVAAAIGFVLAGRAIAVLWYEFPVGPGQSERAVYGHAAVWLLGFITLAFVIPTVILALQRPYDPLLSWDGFRWVPIPDRPTEHGN